jgi:hypothetical protein
MTGTTKEITLDDFIDRAIDHVRTFAKVWRENMDENPEDWPYNLPEAEWWEQLIIFDE